MLRRVVSEALEISRRLKKLEGEVEDILEGYDSSESGSFDTAVSVTSRSSEECNGDHSDIGDLKNVKEPVSILSLPDTILSQIFREVQSSESCQEKDGCCFKSTVSTAAVAESEDFKDALWSFHAPPLALSLVNVRFRRVALEDPLLWNNVSNLMPLAKLQNHLRLAGQSGLHVTLRLPSRDDRPLISRGSTYKQISALVARSQDWVSLRLSGPVYREEDIGQLKKLSLPKLEELHIQDLYPGSRLVPNPGSSVSRKQFLSKWTLSSSLKILTIPSDVLISIDIPKIPVSLESCTIVLESTNNLGAVLKFLRTSRALKHLKFVIKMNGLVEFKENFGREFIVHKKGCKLPHVKSLEIMYISKDSLSGEQVPNLLPNFLSQLKLPVVEDLTLTLRFDLLQPYSVYGGFMSLIFPPEWGKALPVRRLHFRAVHKEACLWALAELKATFPMIEDVHIEQLYVPPEESIGGFEPYYHNAEKISGFRSLKLTIPTFANHRTYEYCETMLKLANLGINDDLEQVSIEEVGCLEDVEIKSLEKEESMEGLLKVSKSYRTRYGLH